MVRKIVSSTDPRLRKISKPVTKLDKKIKGIIADLKDTLEVQKNPEGVGLAAPQIGKNVRIFYMSYQGFKKIVVNPQILKVKGAKGLKHKKTKKTHPHEHEILEGCLSLPHYYGPLKRSPFVTLKYTTEEGKQKIENFEDFLAQIVLHEVDHLNGVFFVDRLLEQKNKLYKLDENDEWEEVEII